MVMKAPSFWSRLAEAMKLKRWGPSNSSDLPAVGDDGLLADPADLVEPPGAEAETAAEKSAGPLSRWSKREQTIVRLQEGYERLNQVIEEIQKHLVLQGERTDRICGSLEQLARSMGDLPGIGRQQAHMLESLAAQIETGNTRMQQVVGAVDEIPKAARAQTETLAGINRNLGMFGEQNVVTAQTLEKLGIAIGSLGQTNSTQIEVLKQMSVKADGQTEQLNRLIARQSKRFTMLFIVTVVLAAAAIATAIVSLCLRR